MVSGKQLHMRLFKALVLKKILICKRWCSGFSVTDISEITDVVIGEYMDKQVIPCVIVCLLAYYCDLY